LSPDENSSELKPAFGIGNSMSASILIVEDEFLVALEMQSILEENGYRVLGIAADLVSAMEYASLSIDLALVDLNLRDGLTGPQIGATLGSKGVTVRFVTANPRLLGNGIAGAIGVITKPTDDEMVRNAVLYALSVRSGQSAEAPPYLRLFG
jgi:DNA-binding response OmpR family regulator